MNFDEWWHKQMPNLVSGEEATDRAIALAAWVAATKVERERCARLVTTGDYCRYVDHNNGTCDCADMAAAIRAS